MSKALGLPTMKEHINEITTRHREIIGSTSSSVFRKCGMCRVKTVSKEQIYCTECLYYAPKEEY